MIDSSDGYAALALQATCLAVNRLHSHQAVYKHMAQTIDHLGELIRGSKTFIRSFSGLETKLIVLPEYFLTGFPMGEGIKEWSEKACIDVNGAQYRALGAICRDNNIYLSGNAYELDSHFPEIYFQTSFIIDPGGEVILRYRRLISMYAPTPHDLLDRYVDIYGEESLFPVVATEIGKLAALASEEILFPEIARALVLRGAEVICHSSSEASSPLMTPKQTARKARAHENMAYIVSANSAGITNSVIPSASTDGGSAVLDYRGAVLAEASNGESMCANAQIDINALRSARKRPGMINMLARQRLELFASTYSQRSIYPANNMLDGDCIIKPDRQHFQTTQETSIARFEDKGGL
jgi:predicted amidohydrolase